MTILVLSCLISCFVFHVRLLGCHTIRRSLEEIRERRKKGISGIDWDKVNAMTPEDIERLADEDDKRLGIDPNEWGEPYWVNGIDELLAIHKREEAEGRESRAQSST